MSAMLRKGPAIRRSIVTVALVVVSIDAWAQTPPSGCGCPPAVAERLVKFLTPAASKAVLQCSKKQSSGCTIDVEMTGSADSCLAKLNYCVVCVRPKDVPRGHAASHPKVLWRLREGGQPSTNFVFNGTKGIDIPDAGKGGKVHFKEPGHGPDRSQFTWKSGPDYSGPLDHAPLVYPKNSTTGCNWVDPIIVNSDQ